METIKIRWRVYSEVKFFQELGANMKIILRIVAVVLVLAGVFIILRAFLGFINFMPTFTSIRDFNAASRASADAFTQVVISWAIGGLLAVGGAALWRYLGNSANQDYVALHLPSEAQKLAQMLNDFFTLEDLRGVCFELNTDWDNLRGDTKDARARELVAYCVRLRRLDELKKLMRTLRPNLRAQLK